MFYCKYLVYKRTKLVWEKLPAVTSMWNLQLLVSKTWCKKSSPFSPLYFNSWVWCTKQQNKRYALLHYYMYTKKWLDVHVLDMYATLSTYLFLYFCQYFQPLNLKTYFRIITVLPTMLCFVLNSTPTGRINLSLPVN